MVTATIGVCNSVAVSLTTLPPLFNRDDPTDKDDDPSLLELLLVFILVPVVVAAADTPTDAAAALNASLSTIDWIRLSSTLGVAVVPDA